MNKYSLKYVGCPIKKRNYRWVLAKSSLLSKPNPRLRLSSLAFSIRSTLILYLLTMSTIDSVTTNFLAFLASSCYRWRCFGTWETIGGRVCLQVFPILSFGKSSDPSILRTLYYQKLLSMHLSIGEEGEDSRERK